MAGADNKDRDDDIRKMLLLVLQIILQVLVLLQ